MEKKSIESKLVELDKKLEWFVENEKRKVINYNKKECLDSILNIYSLIVEDEDFISEFNNHNYWDKILNVLNIILNSRIISFYDSLEIMDLISILNSDIRTYGKYMKVPFFGYKYVIYKVKVNLYYI